MFISLFLIYNNTCSFIFTERENKYNIDILHLRPSPGHEAASLVSCDGQRWHEYFRQSAPNALCHLFPATTSAFTVSHDNLCLHCFARQPLPPLFPPTTSASTVSPDNLCLDCFHRQPLPPLFSLAASASTVSPDRNRLQCFPCQPLPPMFPPTASASTVS